MAAKPKKGKGGKRKKGPKEPKHDSGWEKTIKYGKWERPIEALPDPNAFPKFGELREKLLSACEQSTTLQTLSLAQCISLKKALLHTNSLKDLNLHQCSELVILMLWSNAIKSLDLCRTDMNVLELCCPKLVDFKPPIIKELNVSTHLEPNINKILEVELLKRPQRHQEEENKKIESEYTPYSSNPLLPRTCLLGF